LFQKKKLGTLPKVGVIGSTASGFTMAYHVINNSFACTPTLVQSSINIKLGQLKNAINTTTTPTSLLNSLFGGIKIEGKIPLPMQDKTMRVSADQTSKVLEELSNTNPNWRDIFINCPSEPGDNSNTLISLIFSALSNSLFLQFICLYLIVMLIIIYTCKYIIDNNINLEPIKGF